MLTAGCPVRYKAGWRPIRWGLNKPRAAGVPSGSRQVTRVKADALKQPLFQRPDNGWQLGRALRWIMRTRTHVIVDDSHLRAVNITPR